MTLKTGLKFCHNFMVVIDTNRFEDYNGTKKVTPYCAARECHTFFTNKSSRQGISEGLYFITQSVFEEIIQQRKEYLSASVSKLKDALKPFDKEIDFSTDVDIEADLKKYLEENHINILPYPPNDIFPKIIRRAVEKRLPFKAVNENKPDKGSDKGFKDVLLWESLLNFNYEKERIGKAFLITNNFKDFSEKQLLSEWKQVHPLIELKIITEWEDFIREEETILSELIAQNNVYYPTVLDLFQGENPDIIELPNFKKKVTGRKDSPIVEIETDVKKKDGTIYSDRYYYDIRVNEPTLFDPDDYDREQEATNDGTLAKN